MYNLVMLYSSLAFLLATFLYFVRIFGCEFRVRRVRLCTLYDITYSSQKRSFSIKQIGVKLHRPRRDSPYWAIIAIDGLEYTDKKCQVSLQRCETKLWILPVLFRFTAGPWIAVTLRGFTVFVNSSRDNPWWVEGLRRNLLSTILNGETIRLNHSDTKVYLSSLTKSMGGYSDEVETSGLHEDEPPEELRVRSSLSQWHILSAWNSRMYTFDDLEAELRRSWVADRGSFVMIAKGCRWTKVPVFGQSEERYRKASTLWQLLHALYSFPMNILRMCTDPISTVDVYASRADITFGDFRLRDAELFHHGAIQLKEEYYKSEIRYPGIMEDFAWDMFVQAVLATFQINSAK